MSTIDSGLRGISILGVLRMKKLAIVCAALVTLCGCASDVANRYYGTPQQYTAKKAEEVQVLWDKPDRPYVVVADFQSRGEGAEDLRKKAARLGADAVIVAYLGGWYSGNEEWAAKDRYSGTYSRIVGTAIKFVK